MTFGTTSIQNSWKDFRWEALFAYSSPLVRACNTTAMEQLTAAELCLLQ